MFDNSLVFTWMTKSTKGLLLLTSVGLRPDTTLPADKIKTDDKTYGLAESTPSF